MYYMSDNPPVVFDLVAKLSETYNIFHGFSYSYSYYCLLFVCLFVFLFVFFMLVISLGIQIRKYWVLTLRCYLSETLALAI